MDDADTKLVYASDLYQKRLGFVSIKEIVPGIAELGIVSLMNFIAATLIVLGNQDGIALCKLFVFLKPGFEIRISGIVPGKINPYAICTCGGTMEKNGNVEAYPLAKTNQSLYLTF
jgi:hypothetical protein